MAKICPNKNTTEYRNLEYVVGEREATRVYLAYGEDIPASFAAEGLSNADIEAMSNYYTHQHTKEEEKYLHGRLDNIIAENPRKPKKKLKGPFKKNEEVFENKLRSTLIEFMNGLGVEVDIKGDDVIDYDYDGTPRKWNEKGAPLAAYDMIQSYIALREDITDQALARQSAKALYFFLGKKSKLVGAIKSNIEQWSGYKEIYDKLKNSELEENRLDFYAREQAIITLLEQMILIGGEFGFEKDTINKFYDNPDINKDYFEGRGFKNDVWEKNFFKKIWYKLVNFYNKHIRGNKRFDDYNEQQLLHLVMEIVDDVYKKDFTKFIRSYDQLPDGTFEDMKGNKMEVKDYEETLNKDPFAKQIIEVLNTRLSNDDNTYKLSGSQVLRYFGRVIRAVNEDLHDIDGVITLEHMQKEEVFDDFLKWIDNTGIELSRDVIEYKPIYFGKTKGKYKKVVTKKGNQKKFTKELTKWLNKMAWYKNLTDIYPGFTLEGAFISNDHMVDNQAISLTMIGYVEHPTLTEIDKKTGKERPKRYQLDFFLRMREGRFPERYDGKFYAWRGILEAKIQMGRAKDLTDLIFFIPEEKYKDRRTFKFKNKGFNLMTFGQDLELGQNLPLEELQNLKVAVQNARAVPKLDESYESLEEKRVTQEKIALLSRSLNAKVIEDSTIDGFAEVDPYKAGETPTIRVNFTKGGLQKDTIIHEYGHIFIDALGGMKNPMVAMGRKHLVGSKIEARILADPNYQNLTKEVLDKEIVAAGIGQEGQKIYAVADDSLMSRFKNWARLFFNKIKKFFGLDYNGAMYLAEQMLNEQVKIDPNVSIGSRVVQKQAFKKSMEPEQESTFSSIDVITTNISPTDDQQHYVSPFVEGKMQRNSNRVDTVYPEQAFPEERGKYYPHSRSWGNINDTIWNSVVEGKNWGQVLDDVEETRASNEGSVYAVKEDQMKLIYDRAKIFVEDHTSRGNVVLAQQRIYSEGTMVAGTTDIIVIKRNGHIDIYDNKTSTNPTRDNVGYGNEGEWSYYDRGRLESYAVKHQKQLSAYAKMYMDLGFVVDNIFIIPTRWLEINKDNATVDKIDNEPTIQLRYEPAYANKIIDNKQKKGKEKFIQDDTLSATIEDLNKTIAERVQVVTAKYETDKDNQAWYNEMQILEAQLATNSSIGNIVEFIRIGFDRVTYVENQLKKIQRTGIENASNDAILIYKTFANTWNLIDDISKISEKIESEFMPRYNKKFEEYIKDKKLPTDVIELEEFADYKRAKFTIRYLELLRPKMKQLSNVVDSVNNKFHSLALEKTAKDLSAVSKWGEAKYRADMFQQYKKDNEQKDRSLSAWEQDAKEWVNEQVAANQTLIANMNYQHFKKLLKEAPKDIDSISMWIADPRNQNDGIIQVAERLLAKAEFEANQIFIKEVRDNEKIYLDFIEYKKSLGISELDYEALYEDIYEKGATEKQATMLVGKYLPKFKEEERKWRAKNRKQGYRPTFAERQKFYNKLRTEQLNPKYEKLMAMEESHPVRKMYDSLITRFQKVDSMLPHTHSLGIAFADDYNVEERTSVNIIQYKLPAIRKSTADRARRTAVGQDSPLEQLKAELSDMFVKTTEYDDSGQQLQTEEGETVGKKFKVKESIKKILVTEQNREAKFVPIHYRSKIESGQQSLDLMSVSMIDYYMASNFNQKRNLVPTMEMLLDVLEERKVIQTDAGGNTMVNAVKGGLPFKLTNKEKASNAFKALHSIIEDRLYGVNTIDVGDWYIGDKKISVNKLGQQIMGWTGDTFLMLNHMAAATGFLQGNVMNWMEAVAGTDITKKSLIKAEAMYLGIGNPRIAAGIFRDIGARRPTGLVNLIAERLNARSDFHGLHSRYGSGAVINLSNKGTLHGLQNMQEHFVQSTLMLGILMDEKLIDKKGQIVTDKEGNEVSLLDAYYVTEDGFLDVKDEYKEYVTKDLEFEMSSRVREVGKQAHGNYDTNNKAMIQRYLLGKMTFMLRKWLVTGVQKRYRGMFTSTGPLGRQGQLGSVEDKFFSESLGRFEEGMYTTATKFLVHLMKDLKFLKLRMVSAEWKMMTPDERANVKRTIFELGMILGSLAAATTIANLAKGTDDDDEKAKLYYAATLLRRLYSELRFYTSLKEGYRILKSPMATLSMVEKVGELLSQGLEDLWSLEFEVYQRGDRKGTTKIGKRLYDIFPILNQMDRNSEEIYKIITNN